MTLVFYSLLFVVGTYLNKVPFFCIWGNYPHGVKAHLNEQKIVVTYTNFQNMCLKFYQVNIKRAFYKLYLE